MKVVYIHGATASERSFAYIQKSIRADNPIYLNYDKDTTAKDNLQNMYDKLDYEDGPFFYVCHSLGGIYATYLQQEFSTATHGCVSLATPFGGSEIATWGSMLNPGYQLFKDITTSSKFIKNSKDIKITCPWTQIVTTEGDVPWLTGRNDGIVTQWSMTCRNDIDYISVDRNHYEIILSQRVVDIIKQRLYK
jgi:pimeloyl-ACP methyl ester carboxylesterase